MGEVHAQLSARREAKECDLFCTTLPGKVECLCVYLVYLRAKVRKYLESANRSEITDFFVNYFRKLHQKVRIPFSFFISVPFIKYVALLCPPEKRINICRPHFRCCLEVVSFLIFEPA